MPTYDYRCPVCAREESVFQSISDYVHQPARPKCCHYADMERKLSVTPAMSGLANALAGDRHYDGLRATDGTPIDSRTKHRQYMKDKGLTMATDYRETWKKAAQERELTRLGQLPDPTLKKEIAEQVMRAVAQPDPKPL